jgi:hypothetical protein
MDMKQTPDQELDECMRHIIEEARVILPGIQALFGFQTIAVFNERFEKIASYAKACHLLGLALVILTIALVMTPATYYRARGGKATPAMERISTSMIRGALAPFALGLALDMFTVINVATGALLISIAAGSATFLLLVSLWFVLPARADKATPPKNRTAALTKRLM